MSEYTLIDKNYTSFVNEVETLFIDKIKNIIEDINLKETYNHIEDLIKNADNKQKQTFSNNNEFLTLIEFDEDREILISCNECNEEDIIELLDTDSQIYSLKLIDRICHQGLSIHFDKTSSHIIFSSKFFPGEHKYILMNNYQIIEDTFISKSNDLNGYTYILWLLSLVGDALFEFSDE